MEKIENEIEFNDKMDIICKKQYKFIIRTENDLSKIRVRQGFDI